MAANVAELSKLLENLSRQDRTALLEGMKGTAKADAEAKKAIKKSLAETIWSAAGKRLQDEFRVGTGGTFSYNAKMTGSDGKELDVQFTIRTKPEAKAKSTAKEDTTVEAPAEAVA